MHDAEAIDHELKARFMAAAFAGSVEEWLQKGMPYPPEYMAKQYGQLENVFYDSLFFGLLALAIALVLGGAVRRNRANCRLYDGYLFANQNFSA